MATTERRDPAAAPQADRYDPGAIEPRWAEEWVRSGLYAAEAESDKPSFYALDMFPYPSGDLHMGHLEAFSGGDVIARYKWMRGFNVLHPIGWDSFGLPAENAAIKRGVHPKEWTYVNIEQQAASFKRLGMSFDWSRRLHTSDPEFYRWTQWLFLRFFERGLAYRKGAPANWCPSCRTVLANEQVIGGLCERCDTPVTKRDLVQWFFKITDYADRLLDDMEHLKGWSDRVPTMQRNWIGRSEGADVVFSIEGHAEKLVVYTTRPDTLWGATSMVLAPEHPLADRLVATSRRDELRLFVERVRVKSEIERTATGRTREGLFLGAHAVNPVNGERLPIWVADYILMEYGTGAIMAVPAHDERDFEFARQEGLPVRAVIQPDGEPPLDGARMTEPYLGEGTMVRSGPLDGTPSPSGIGAVIDWLEEQGFGSRSVRYRLRDWLLSRQRYWGAPIPIVHCRACGEVAVPDDQLPVLLPDDVDLSQGAESPLARHEGFVAVDCPSCGKPARRDTDTMDTFVDSSWYLFRYCGAPDDAPFDADAVARWMPVDQYTGGIEHAILHLLYTRFFTKVLYDMGMIPFEEPFPNLLNQGQVIMAGAAMSKSRGNLVAPKEIVDEFGADTARVTMLFAGPFEADVDWADVSPQGVYRWLSRVWRLANEHGARAGAAEGDGPLRRATHQAIEGVTVDMERFRFNTAIAKMMTLTNELSQRGADASDGDAHEAVDALIRMLAPFAPFVTEELWDRLGREGSVHRASWPEADPALTRQDTVTMIVQVSGKVRDRIDVPADTTEERMLEAARASRKVAASLGDAEIVRTIVVPPKLVNFVVR